MAHLKPITPLTIEAIRAHEWCGNHHSDAAAFASIDQFAADESQPMEHRAEALRISGLKGMGLSEEEALCHVPDALLVAEFMASREG